MLDSKSSLGWGRKPLSQSRSHNEKKIKFPVGVFMFIAISLNITRHSYVNSNALKQWFYC